MGGLGWSRCRPKWSSKKVGWSLEGLLNGQWKLHMIVYASENINQTGGKLWPWICWIWLDSASRPRSRNAHPVRACLEMCEAKASVKNLKNSGNQVIKTSVVILPWRQSRTKVPMAVREGTEMTNNQQLPGYPPLAPMLQVEAWRLYLDNGRRGVVIPSTKCVYS